MLLLLLLFLRFSCVTFMFVWVTVVRDLERDSEIPYHVVPRVLGIPGYAARGSAPVVLFTFPFHFCCRVVGMTWLI